MTLPFRLVLPLTALLVGISVGGCSSSPTVTPKKDGGADGPRDTGGLETADTVVDQPTDSPVTPDLPAAEMPPPTCDPVAQPCGAGMKCDFSCPLGALSCLTDPGGTLMHGAVCGSAPCARGHICSTPTGAPAPVCYKYCNGNSDCPAGLGCAQFTVRCTMGTATPVTIKMCQQPTTPDAGVDSPLDAPDDAGDDAGDDSGTGG